MQIDRKTFLRLAGQSAAALAVALALLSPPSTARARVSASWDTTRPPPQEAHRSPAASGAQNRRSAGSPHTTHSSKLGVTFWMLGTSADCRLRLSIHCLGDWPLSSNS